MSEVAKTATFGTVAVVSAVLAFVFRGNVGDFDPPDEVGSVMFSEFDNVLNAKSLKITRFDESLAKFNEIEIKEVDGIWVLPSHNNYPADADDRIKDATTPFVDLNVLRVASDSDKDHALYGVNEPSKDSTAGDEGVGTRVVIKDAGGNALVDMVIGKEVKGQDDQRYVRRTGKTRVYVTKVDPSKLPVRFDDWIKKDLLGVSSFEIENLTLKDFSFEVLATFQGLREDFQQRMEATLSEESSKWKLDKFLVGDNKGQLMATELLETEELNEERIDGLRDALADLKIVDVEPKPEGLSSDLKADQGFANNNEGASSLFSRGFYPVRGGDVLSSDGEVLATTKDGVQYVMRFGKPVADNEDGGEAKLNRYLLVSARVNPDKFPAPELEPLPELPKNKPSEDADGEAAVGTEEASGNDESAEVENSDASESESTEGDAPVEGGCGPQEDAEPAETASDDATADSEEVTDTDETTEATTDEAVTKDDSAEAESASDEEAADEASSEDSEGAADTSEAAADDAATEEKPAETETSADAASSDESADGTVDESADAEKTDAEANEEAAPAEEKDVFAEYERISKENQRKIEERQDKIKKAQEKVYELNYRFADWYYVISEDVYKKIHLGRADIIKESEAAKDSGFGVDALNNLKDNFGKEPAETTPPPAP